MFRRSILGLLLLGSLSGCFLLKDPIIGKWQFTPPGLAAGIVVEFKQDGTATYDISGVEKAVGPLAASNPVVKQMVDRALSSFRNVQSKWKKTGGTYELTTTVAGQARTTHLKLQGETLTPSDEKGAPKSGAPSWTRVKDAK